MSEIKAKSAKSTVWLAVLGIAILAGLYTTYKVVTEGLTIYGANDQVVWTLPLAAYTFFSLMSAGSALVATLPQVLGFQQFVTLTKRTTVLSIAALVAAFICMFLELGNPWHMLSYITSPNPSSSLWGLGVLYLLQFVFLLIMFWRLNKGKSFKWLAIFVFGLAVLSSTTLGSTFGLVEARSFYFGEFMPIYFLLNALLSGLAVIILANLFQKIGHVEDLDKLLRIVLGVALIFFVWRTFVGLYASSPEFESFKHMFGTWMYQVEFWLGLALPFLLLLVPTFREMVWARFSAAGLVLAGIFVRSLLLVESGLSIPGDPRLTGVPGFVTVSYTVWEWLAFVFALAVLFLLYTIGDKYFNLETA